MTVRIEEVSQSTWRTIAALKVSESQRTLLKTTPPLFAGSCI